MRSSVFYLPHLKLNFTAEALPRSESHNLLKFAGNPSAIGRISAAIGP
jgi:hypothetical protein